MSGYGGPDDEQERAQQRIDELVALSRSQLPLGPGASECVECGEPIPIARQKAMPGTTHCIRCQVEQDKLQPKFKEPWAT